MKNSEYNKLEDRLQQLTYRLKDLELMFPNFDNQTIDDIHRETAQEAQSIQKQLGTKREYLFNFKSGGWNSEYAFTEEQAIEQAIEKYGNPKTQITLQIDTTSFRVSTSSDYQNLLSLFN
jgi:hypothetical protein